MAEDSDTARRLRPKERRVYTDGDADEDDLEAKRKFCVVEKTLTNNYNASFVKEVRGEDLSLRYFQEHGFTMPLIIREKTGLGMRMPSDNFKVSDVKQCVGSRRQLDVMDVNTQKGLEMSMKDWVRYYENPDRERLLNVISLEFSCTRLENYVEQPQVARHLDWVENAWPRFHKDSQTECTNIIEKMKYPKVQKYCLMSVRGCYTDFHIDMGGTSVWYHLLHGSKLFWLIPPTERNIQLYEHWVLSGKQGDMFFGDKVEKCQRLELVAGYTFFIPTGWIHAVYTSEDSLVFGGNFLHSFNIPMQLRISEVEDKTKVPQKFRYPFFQELHWYLLDQYVNCLMGRSYRDKSDEELAEEADERLKTAGADDATEDISLRSTEEDDGGSPQRSSAEESIRTYSPHPLRPKSPQSPTGSASPRPASTGNHHRRSHDENTAPKSPKGASRSPRATESPTPGSGGVRMGRLDTGATKEGVIRRPDQSPGRRTEWSDFSMKKRLDIKTYMYHQSELIKPVSVKLENCMLTTAEGKSYLDGSSCGLSCGSSSSAAAGTAMGNLLPTINLSANRGPWTHLTQWELKGLRVLVKWLEEMPPNKRVLPKDLQDYEPLLRDVKKLLVDHAADDARAAITGDMVIKWPPRKGKKVRHLNYTPRVPKGTKKKDKEKQPKAKVKDKEKEKEKEKEREKEREKEKERERERERERESEKEKEREREKEEEREREKDTAAIRRRRVRCKVCEACTRGDCRECHFCSDMKKYGGAGKMKQSCKSRQCMMPVLPTSAVCSVCGKDDRLKVEGMPEPVTTLMECGICWDIAHPACMGAEAEPPQEGGVVNEDLPNSWECPKCCGDRKQGQLKPRPLKSVLSKIRADRIDTSGSEASRTEFEDNGSPMHDPHDFLSDIPKRARKHEFDDSGSPHRGWRRPREHEVDSPPVRKKVKNVEDGRGTPGKGQRTPLLKGKMTSRGREIQNNVMHGRCHP